jgi:hypothetical protein
MSELSNEEGTLGMPETTLEKAAQELHNAVVALTELVNREYPSRREVERRFASKAYMVRNWKIFLSIMVGSTLLSFVGTVSVISTCFLGSLDRPEACKMLPGYSETFKISERRVGLIQENAETTLDHEKRIAQLERQLKELRKEN